MSWQRRTPKTDSYSKCKLLHVFAHVVTFYNSLSALFGQKELGGSTSSRRDDSTGRRSAKGSAPGSTSGSLTFTDQVNKINPNWETELRNCLMDSFVVFQICVICLKGPPRERDALVLRAQFSIGDRVEYRSDTHRQWLPGTVSEPLCVSCFFVH